MTHPLAGVPQKPDHIAKRRQAMDGYYRRNESILEKACTCCGSVKPVEEFGIRSGRSHGWHSKCTNCRYTETKRWKAANKDKTAANKRAFQERSRAHRSAYQNLRHAATLQRTVPWADLDAVKGMYELCAVFRRAGLDLQVDHIIPMQGELVSGLHVESNLQLLHRLDNISKKNRFNVGAAAI